MPSWHPDSRHVTGWPRDLRDAGPSGPVVTRQMTDEERARVDALPKPTGGKPPVGNSWGGRAGLSWRQVRDEQLARKAAAANGTGTIDDSLPPAPSGQAWATETDVVAPLGPTGSYSHESKRLSDRVEGEGEEMPRGVPLVQDDQAFQADLRSGRSQQAIAETWGITVDQLRIYCGRLHIPRPPMRCDAADGELVPEPKTPSAVYPAFGADTGSAPVVVDREYLPIAARCTPSPLDSIRERIASDLERARADAYTADLRRDRLARALEAVDSALAALAEAGVSA